ncbi:hypothetical protein EDB19DRAFT_175905 [Suillus lakei]|nr:hypothetical protein EDB19DRAFT_175905 [Suillus lakei]
MGVSSCGTKIKTWPQLVPILPKPSQQRIERDWSPGTLCPVPRSINLDVFMDLTQNLIAVAYTVNKKFYIDLRALDSGGIHPQATVPRLFLLGLPRSEGNRIIGTEGTKLKGCGKHLALRRCLYLPSRTSACKTMWQLQIWDWQESPAPKSVLNHKTQNLHGIEFCFLGNNRLLVVKDNLELYSIEDTQAPQLLASFLWPFNLSIIRRWCLTMDDIECSSQPQMQVQQATYTSDPKHRLLCLSAASIPPRVFIISTRIFFDLDETAATTPIPWTHWGPSNARIFEHLYQCKVNVSGSRVLLAIPVDMQNSGPEEYILTHVGLQPTSCDEQAGSRTSGDRAIYDKHHWHHWQVQGPQLDDVPALRRGRIGQEVRFPRVGGHMA